MSIPRLADDLGAALAALERDVELPRDVADRLAAALAAAFAERGRRRRRCLRLRLRLRRILQPPGLALRRRLPLLALALALAGCAPCPWGVQIADVQHSGVRVRSLTATCGEHVYRCSRDAWGHVRCVPQVETP